MGPIPMKISFFRLQQNGGSVWVCLLVLFLFTLSSGVESTLAAGNSPRKIKVNLMGGRVFRLTGAGGAETPLTKWHGLSAGHRIRTDENARVELVFVDRCVLRLGPASMLSIVSDGGGLESVRAVLMAGNLWANVPGDPARSIPVAVATDVVIAVTMAGIFRVIVHPDDATEIKVYDGTISISGRPEKSDAAGRPGVTDTDIPSPAVTENWEHYVTAFRKLVAWPAGRVTKPYRFAAKADQDNWVQWNRQRDGTQGISQ